MHRVAERVEDGGDVVVDVVGDLVHVERRHRDVLGEAAVALHPDADRVAAQVPSSGTAVAARAAGDVPLGGDAAADLDVAYLVADGRDGAHVLVADREGGGDRGGRPLVPVVDVEVRATDRHSLHGDEHLVGPDLGLGHVGQHQAGPGRWLHERSHQAITSSSRPTSTKAAIARSSCSGEWAALIWVRMRAVPVGTTG